MTIQPLIGVVMNVRDDGAEAVTALASVRELVGHWTVVDTGSTNDTAHLIEVAMDDLPGELHHEPWVGYAHNRTHALELARDTADWLLWLDADMTATWHHELPEWLASDPDPETDAWNVEIADNGTVYRLPLLLRGGKEWLYSGAVHEYLDAPGRKTRSLLGLTVIHHGGHREGQFENDLELLRPGFHAGDPRDTFYFAETLRFLGRTNEAIAAYQARAAMAGTFEEERWYAQYQAAKLAGNVSGLLEAHRSRPWRHEPLSAAARLVASQGTRDDLLFIETGAA